MTFPITLLTDFGHGSPYVAAMKGVILSINPAAVIVDLAHDVPPQDIRAGALLLEDVAPRFPPGTIHVAVVDPGVGTDRPIVYARIGHQAFVCPDNGLLSRLLLGARPARLFRLENPDYWLQPVSKTFHGRDIMAPVAARLSLGLDPALLGPPHAALVTLDWPAPRVLPGRIEGHVLRVDAFGNLITDIPASLLAEVQAGLIHASCRGQRAAAHVPTYAQAPPGALVSLIGSSDRVELAVAGGSAAARLGAAVGDAVHVTW